MTAKPDLSDLNAMAVEACDIWQAQLSALAHDPTARAELTRFLEPQRRMFADWATLMQKTAIVTPAPADATTAAQPEPGASKVAAGDDPLKSAQLAMRVAGLEQRLSALEDEIRSLAANMNVAPPRA